MSRHARRSSLPVSLATAALLCFATPSGAEFPFPNTSVPDVYDYASYLFIDNASCNGDSSDLPSNVDCSGTSDWQTTDYRDASRLDTAQNPQEHYGVIGPQTNMAWRITTGRPDVVIAIIDDGVRWDESISYANDKYWINRGELPLPDGGPNPSDTLYGGYDVNGDGVFNASDYATDPAVSDHNGNGLIDPQDLIRTFSDDVDGDGNGYVDDIAGWDFYENDNDPNDDPNFSHGNTRVRESAAEAGVSSHDGQCPNCMVMALRVSDSFVAEINHWGEATTYAADNGAHVIEDALGTLNHTSFGQSGTHYAYYNGLVINASQADEAAGHHNWPAAYEHTMLVNAVREVDLLGPQAAPYSFLHLSGCTNFGGYSFVSIPSERCSSGAAGRSSGQSGLLISAALNAIDRGDMTRYLLDNGGQAPYALSGEEIKQLWRLAADDIDFSTPCPGHAFCDEAPPDVTTPVAPPNNYGINLADSTRYQTVRGWDYFTGYGRSNVYRLVSFIGLEDHPLAGSREWVGPGSVAIGADTQLTAQDRIPPEADITSPLWFGQFPYRPDYTLLDPQDPAQPEVVVVEGRAAANRVTAAGGSFDYVLEWAPHVQGQKHPVGDLQAAAGAQELSAGPWFPVVTATGFTSAVTGELGRIPVANLVSTLNSNPNPFDPATDPTSEYQPERFAIRLRLRVIAHPVNTADQINNEAVMQKQIDVYPAEESAILADLGVQGQIAGGSGSAGFHDLDGDGVDELIVASSDGLIHAYTDVATRSELPGWPAHTLPFAGVLGSGSNGFTSGAVQNEVYNSVFAGTPAVADLDDDGALEVVVSDFEGHVYAFQVDGSQRAGFPVRTDVSLAHQAPCTASTIPLCDQAAPDGPVQDKQNRRDWGITAMPAVGDLDPAHPGLEIVVGSHDAHVYAWRNDGTLVPGWPVVLRDPAKVATMDASTRTITLVPDAGGIRDGGKIIVTPSLGDLDGDSKLEVVLGVNEQYVEPPNAALDPAYDALAAAGVDPGNARIYALHHDGANHPATAAHAATPHLQDQAYVDGWPVKIAVLAEDLLPDVGISTNGQSPLVDVDGDGSLEIVTASAIGPAYILNHDGTSFLGSDNDGKYITLASSGGVDSPSYVALGAMTVASLDAGTHYTVIGAGLGLKRLLDVVLPADQLATEDHLALWNATTGAYEPNSPVIVNDLQFFSGAIAGDVDGDGLAEAVQSTAMSDTVVVGLGEPAAAATRYHHGGWAVNFAGLGDAPMGAQDDGLLQLATMNREGYLRLYPTSVAADGAAGCTALSEWPEYGHDAHNSGNYHHDGERPHPLRDVSAPAEVIGTTVDVDLSASGDDRYCGSADRYLVRRLPGNVADPDWNAAAPFADLPVGAPAGGAETLTLGGLSAGEQTLLIRAFDEAGNGSVPARIVVLPEPARGAGLVVAVAGLLALARRGARTGRSLSAARRRAQVR